SETAAAEVTRLTTSDEAKAGFNEQSLLTSAVTKSDGVVRRLIAARDDTRALYLNTPGYRVGCKDEVLVVKEKDRVIEEVRMRDVSRVALFGNIQISTQAIQSLCEQDRKFWSLIPLGRGDGTFRTIWSRSVHEMLREPDVSV